MTMRAADSRRTGVPAMLLALLTLAVAVPAEAETLAPTPPTPESLAQQWTEAEAQLAQAAADAQRLAGEPGSDQLLLQARHVLQVEDAAFRYRDAARTEQVVVYAMAVDGDLDRATEPMLPAAQLPAVRSAIAGLQALWRSAGITDLSAIRIRHNRDFHASVPVGELVGYYQSSGDRYAIDWSFLASINYIESDFGRVLGPSSAGALGPMQFMPQTWAGYGAGGDIMNPHDSIDAAARYLKAMGGPGNMDRAIYRYNNDRDYVASVQAFAAAFRADPTWVTRMYYWSTTG